MKRQRNWSNILLWTIYLALLAVLLPHTAWAFGRFESPAVGWLNVQWGMVTAWAAAFAFEAAIAALTHKLAKHIETTPRYTAGRVWLRRISHQYLNAYAAGLLVAVGVSVLANFGHAVEFGRDFATPAQGRYCVFGQYKIPRQLYSLAFGGILPLVSLMFARILANTAETEAEVNPELSKAKQTIKELRSELKAAKDHLANAEARANAAEQRFSAAGDLVARLFAEEKRQRILAAAEHWPELPASSIAIITSASPGYVSEVLKAGNGR
ncbi:MAG: hypothetical protein GQ526_07855 [Ardenticatenales bacterium]|nr:hypothetical protein [Ardenticatenales bacterium]